MSCRSCLTLRVDVCYFVASFLKHMDINLTLFLQMPDHFDQTVVLNQLRYSGMLETVKIRRTGFPVRRSFQDFCCRSGTASDMFVCVFTPAAVFVTGLDCT